MSGVTWSKFFWADWRSDPAVRLCSLSARGLWIDMLSFISEADGYLLISGKAPSVETLARLTGTPIPDVEAALKELEEHGVFSRTARGVIYSRRLVRAFKKSEISRKNGKFGGNPTLGKDKGNSGWDNLNPGSNQKPEPELDVVPSSTTQHVVVDDWPSGGLDVWVAELAAISNGWIDPQKSLTLVSSRGIVGQWKLAGCSFELDVKPAIQAACAKRSAPISAWSYFQNIIPANRARRLAAPDLTATGGTYVDKLTRRRANEISAFDGVRAAFERAPNGRGGGYGGD